MAKLINGRKFVDGRECKMTEQNVRNFLSAFGEIKTFTHNDYDLPSYYLNGEFVFNEFILTRNRVDENPNDDQILENIKKALSL